MSEITIDTHQTDQLALVVVSGNIDFTSVAELRAVLHPALIQQRKDVLLDLSRVNLLDARAISVLLQLANEAEAGNAEGTGGQLQILGARGMVLEVLQITGAAKQLGVYERSQPYARREHSHAQVDDSLPRALSHLARLPRDSPTRRQLRERVVTDLLPLAAQLARRFRDRGESREDLTQVAVVALINAIDRYDPARGDFFPFAVTTMTGELKRHLRDRGWAVRPPRRLQELSLEVRWAETQLGQRLGRSPTSADVAAFLDVPEDTVVEAMTAHQARRSTSLHTPLRAADLPLLETLGSHDRRLDDIESWVSLRSLIADLPDRTRRILEMRFGAGMTQTQIAQAVGLSQMHISRILTSTMDRLRRALQGEDQPNPAFRGTAKSPLRRRSIG
jgi:RNA polymerase sigma-B factor